MKGLTKRWIGFSICVCLLVCGAGSSFAASAKEVHAQIEPRMTYIASYTANLIISSKGIAYIEGTVLGKSGVTQTSVKVTLQKSVSGAWVDVESWEASSDSRSATVTESYQVARGTYRIEMTCSANGETKSYATEATTY